MSTLQTRVATLQDLESVALLFDAYRQFYGQPNDLALATRFIAERMHKSQSVILLAQDDEGRALGFCQLYPSYSSIQARPIYTLSDLFVDPRQRKAGTGRQLLLAAEEHARHNRFAKLELTTARTNLAAQSLYESLGWERDEIFLAYEKHTGA